MNTFLGVSLLIWILVCLLLATIYFIFIPKEGKSSNASPIQKQLIGKGHATVWVFLAIAAALSYFQYFTISKGFLWLSLALYILFLGTFISVKSKNKKAVKSKD